MFTIRHAGFCWGLAAILCLAVAVRVQAGPNDILEQQKQLLKVAADKMEQQTNDALAEAKKIAASDPTQATAVLKKVLAQLESDNALTDARRNSLIKTVKDRIIAIKGAAAEKPVKGGDAKSDTETTSEQKIINRTLELIEKMQREGRTAEASRLANDLARRYPDNAAVKAAVRTTAAVDATKSGQEIVNDADKRILATLNQTDKSAIPPNGDVEFPKDWAKKMADRKGLNEQILSAKELQILKALSSTIKPEYSNASLTDVLDDLATKLNVTFVVDKASLSDAGVTSDTQVNLNFPRGVAARTGLRKILSDLGLTYVIKNETVQIVSEAKAKEMMVTRTYYIGALMAGGQFNDAGIRFNPWFDQIQAAQNVKALVEMIQGSIDPQSWEANGGKGTIKFYAPTMAIIIRQSAEVHGMMGGGSAK